MGQPGKKEPGTSCPECGHAAGLHSNEACEAIRCHCHVTRKLLASAAVSVARPVAATTAPVVVAPVSTREHAVAASPIASDGSPVQSRPPAVKAKKRRESRDGRPGETHAA